MFHRMPLISATAVFTTAFIFLLTVLFASSLSSPGTAQASHSDPPEVSIVDLSPEVGEEGGHVRVTLRLSRQLTQDEKFCYPSKEAGEAPRNEVCIEGGIWGMDSYNDHLPGENTNTSDENFAFVFRGSETEKRLHLRIKDDQCITPGRTMRVSINSHYRSDTYGYIIDTKEHTVRIAGNDETNGTLVDDDGKCAAVDDGVTEDIFTNAAPRFGSQPESRSVDENTVSGDSIGSPVTANDPDEGDTLTYSLTGAAASHFGIDSSTGQILTDGPLDHETQDTYHLAVAVTDGKDIYGNSNSSEDDSIDVTIKVNDVDEPPDAPAAPTVTAKAGTTDSLEVSWTAPDNAGRPDITGYELQYQVEGTDPAVWRSANITVTDTKATITGLDSNTNYEVQVKATNDEGMSPWSDSGEGPTNNTPPTFDEDQGSGATRFVPENRPVGTDVGLPVAATDDSSSLTYNLEGTDAASFDIVSDDGQIQTISGVTYDHEATQNSYSVRVKATDNEGSTGTIAVTITVTDVDEPPDAPAAPRVKAKAGTADSLDVRWTAPDNAGKPVISGYKLQYQVKGTDPPVWSPANITGTETTAEITGLESGTTYEVQVMARNDEGDSDWSESGEGRTENTVPTFDEEIPQDQDSLSRSVPENSGAGVNVGAPVVATDTDGDDLTYTLEGTDAASFDIVSDDGQIQTKEGVTYDHETKSSYSVTVKADDSKGGTATIAVTINVTNEDEDGTVTFSGDDPESLSVQENTPAGEDIGDTFTATDDAPISTARPGSWAEFRRRLMARVIGPPLPEQDTRQLHAATSWTIGKYLQGLRYDYTDSVRLQQGPLADEADTQQWTTLFAVTINVSNHRH